MNRLTPQQRQHNKARTRIKFYLDGGARPVYISRSVLMVIVILFWLAIWWSNLP